MHRVKLVLNGPAMYALYCSLILPYLSYCCEVWGNTYHTKIQPLFILQKRAIRICAKLEYRAHTKPAFLKFNTLSIVDLIKFKSMVIMFKIYHNLMPANTISRFQLVRATHGHNTRQRNNFKRKYCRTTLKSMCLSTKGPKIWYSLHASIKECTNLCSFKRMYGVVIQQIVLYCTISMNQCY